MVIAGDPWMTMLDVRDGKILNQLVAHMSLEIARQIGVDLVEGSGLGGPTLWPERPHADRAKRRMPINKNADADQISATRRNP
jgi:hypothetical protein